MPPPKFLSRVQCMKRYPRLIALLAEIDGRSTHEAVAIVRLYRYQSQRYTTHTTTYIWPPSQEQRAITRALQLRTYFQKYHARRIWAMARTIREEAEE
jgi:hypothetical protein